MNSDAKAIVLAVLLGAAFVGGFWLAGSTKHQDCCKCEVQHKHGEKIGSPVGSQK
jgi:hypothetical protein